MFSDPFEDVGELILDVKHEEVTAETEAEYKIRYGISDNTNYYVPTHNERVVIAKARQQGKTTLTQKQFEILHSQSPKLDDYTDDKEREMFVQKYLNKLYKSLDS